jgi:hypothetical protein
MDGSGRNLNEELRWHFPGGTEVDLQESCVTKDYQNVKQKSCFSAIITIAINLVTPT